MSGTNQAGMSYRFVVRGELDDHFAVVFGGMRIERVAGSTILTGNVIDQSHLYGLLERVQELGMELVSVEPGREVADAKKTDRTIAGARKQ
jgi:hypothetical protein